MSSQNANGRKHVLFLTAAFPSPCEPSRAVSVANAARLLSRDFKVTVVAPRVHRCDPLSERNEDYGIARFPYHTDGRILKNHSGLPVTRLLSYLNSGLSTVLASARVCPVNLIYANWILPTGLIGAVASKLLAVPLVLHAHGSDVNVFARANPVFRMLARKVLNRSSRVLAVGHDLLRTLGAEFDLPSGKVAYSPPIVGNSVFYPGRRSQALKKLGLTEDTRLVLFVGDITVSKGAGLFARAAKITGLSGLSTRFAMLGDGPLRSRLLRENTHGNSILLPGAVSNEEVALYMKAADLMVLPSLTEGRPVSVLEAMQTGLPVLATRVGDIPELIKNGVNGILIEPDSLLQLKEKLCQLLSNPELLNRLRDGAMQRVKEEQSPLPSLLREIMQAPDYNRYWCNAQPSHFKKRARERARAALSLLPGGVHSVLDAGCGRGETLQMLTSCGYDASGVDVSSVAVNKAKEQGLKAEILDLEKDSIDQEFDTVVCMEVLEHLSKPETALRKLAGVLKDGGRLVVSLPNEKNAYHLLKNLFAPNPAHIHRFTHGRALALFARADLKVEKRVSLPVLPRVPGFGLLRRALCRLWPAAFTVSNVYLLKPGSSVLDPDENRK